MSAHPQKRPQGVWAVSIMLAPARYLKSRHRSFEAARKRASQYPHARVSIRDTRLPLNPFGNLKG